MRTKQLNIYPFMRRYILSIVLIILIFCSTFSYGQENEFSRSSLRAGFGLGINDALRETGIGTLYSFGYQRSLWKNRIRVSPYLMTGGFTSIGFTDTRDQFYRVTSLGINGYLDIVKYRSVSLFIGTGVFTNYSRGLLGTGGELHQDSDSEYFCKMYYGVNIGTGFRIAPKRSRMAVELNPINVYFGNDYFTLGFMQVSLDIKLNAIKQ